MFKLKMTRALPIAVAVFIAACVSEPAEQGVVAKNDAVEDYIVAAELPPVDSMRTNAQMRHRTITDRYIILQDRKTHHLITFKRRCRELRESKVTPDIRHENNRLRARFDTYRGCQIDKMYEIDAGQAQELLSLSEDSAN